MTLKQHSDALKAYISYYQLDSDWKCSDFIWKVHTSLLNLITHSLYFSIAIAHTHLKGTLDINESVFLLKMKSSYTNFERNGDMPDLTSILCEC